MSAPPRRAAEISATMPERGVQAFCKTMLCIGISFLLLGFYTRLLRHGQEVKYAFRFELQRDTSIPDFSKPTMRWITAEGRRPRVRWLRRQIQLPGDAVQRRRSSGLPGRTRARVVAGTRTLVDSSPKPFFPTLRQPVEELWQPP
jgi:hypothetical protein